MRLVEELSENKMLVWDYGITQAELETLCNAWHDGRSVVSPFKIGDIVFSAWEHGFILEWKVTRIIIHINGTSNKPLVRCVITCENHELDDMDFWDSDIGKTVFLTREEVERALESPKSDTST